MCWQNFAGSRWGPTLLTEIERRLAANGVREVALETATDNESAVAFWQKHGYRSRGVQKGYYPGGRDAFAMSKTLSPLESLHVRRRIVFTEKLKHMHLWQAIVLAVVQGLTEFLPISSSAHLILIPELLHWQDPGMAFDVALHVGTLIAVLLYFFRDWIQLTLCGLGFHYPKRASEQMVTQNQRHVLVSGGGDDSRSAGRDFSLNIGLKRICATRFRSPAR